jgi:hypothetical protein
VLSLQSAFAQVINLKGRWKFHIGDDPTYSSSTLDDSGWEDIWVPAAWEDEGFNGYDGFAWYRIKFDGRKLDKDGVYFANLGYIDDADEAYLNDRIIGFSGQCAPKFKTAYNDERKYVIPSQLINFSGMNTLAIRVFDGVHRGGIVDGKVGIYSMEENARLLIDLQGVWSFARSSKGERVTDESTWEKIMVPGAWEHQGMKMDGFGWYKKTFNVPANFTKQPVVLLLGKIDDFDRVYFNGKFIGSTNDRRPYGSSHSYQESRVYGIPAELIKYNGPNTIEVLVEDTGNIGGIYEGTIGITTRSASRNFSTTK